MGAPAEAEPLIAKQASGPPPREWKNHLLNPVGDCEAVDVAACCLSFKFPFVAFGWNSARALRKSFWLEALAYLLGLVAVCEGGHAAFYMILKSFCPVPPAPMGAVEVRLMMGHGHMGHSSMMDDRDQSVTVHQHGMHGMHGSDSDMDMRLTEQCMAQAAPYLALVATLVILGLFLMTYWVAKRRQAIREQFGIQGTFWGDLAAWYCCAPCALTQETRTMLHNNVHGGLWHGPLPMAMPPALPAMGVPAGQQMV